MEPGIHAYVPTTSPSTSLPEGGIIARAFSSFQSPVLGILQKLKEAIWARRPVIQELMQTYGEQTLFDYTRKLFVFPRIARLDARKDELIDTAERLIAERLGATKARQVADQLRRFPLVSTTDHHAPIQHPFWVNADLISALPYWECTDSAINTLVVFSFATVSMNNASGYPRGLLFHGGVNGSGNLVKLPIFPEKDKMAMVYATRAFTRDDIAHSRELLAKKEREGEVVAGRGDKIRELLSKYFETDDVLSAKDFNEQITKINAALWPALFHGLDPEKHEQSKKSIPELLYLEIETLVREVLMEHHWTDTSSNLWKLLFDAKSETLVKKYFNNVSGNFSLEKDWGTYLFWGLNQKQQRVSLMLDQGMLHSADNSIAIPMTPDAIASAMKKKEIMPAMGLCYITVAFHYGFTCLGGFCQIHDLTVMKQAWAGMLNELAEKEEADAALQVETKHFGGDGLVLAYFRSLQGGLVPATGIDMVVEHVNTQYADFVELSKKVRFAEAMNPLVPEMYTVLFPNEQRDQELLTIKPEQIMSETGLQKKLEKEIAVMEKGGSIHTTLEHTFVLPN